VGLEEIIPGFSAAGQVELFTTGQCTVGGGLEFSAYLDVGVPREGRLVFYGPGGGTSSYAVQLPSLPSVAACTHRGAGGLYRGLRCGRHGSHRSRHGQHLHRCQRSRHVGGAGDQRWGGLPGGVAGTVAWVGRRRCGWVGVAGPEGLGSCAGASLAGGGM
jgi:hypothetical protein